jgi:16S rRNA processing protein RimM
MNKNRILLGVITSAHGIRGEVKIKSFTDDPKALGSYGPLQDKTGKRNFVVKVQGEQKGMVLAAIEGVRNRNAAELLRGTELYAERNLLPSMEEGEYFVEDLIGMDVMQDGETVGAVKAFHNFGAGDILEIAFSNGREELFSFTGANFPDIDLAARRVTFCPPEVLIIGDKPTRGEP